KTGDFSPERYFNINREDMPTAYLCSSDSSANFFAARLQQDGLTVPKDVSLAGFEDFLPNHLSGLHLTSCRVNLEEIAEKAVTTIVRKIEGTLYTPGTFEVSGTLSFGSSVKKIGKAVSFV
ncbi:substrate-binding domain-containing protein, partial [Blautia massiliensis (ex Durand et al. 2017)]|uniref:substrate-binding domain-containing protein n=1 Tax=Blautia massiliensis (ex Durand et al. 2017) TaxID=1737424 RepID=UPI0024312C51